MLDKAKSSLALRNFNKKRKEARKQFLEHATLEQQIILQYNEAGFRLLSDSQMNVRLNSGGIKIELAENVFVNDYNFRVAKFPKTPRVNVLQRRHPSLAILGYNSKGKVVLTIDPVVNGDNSAVIVPAEVMKLAVSVPSELAKAAKKALKERKNG